MKKKDSTNGWNNPEVTEVITQHLKEGFSRSKEPNESERLLKLMYTMYIEGHGIGQKTLRDTQDYLKQNKLI